MKSFVASLILFVLMISAITLNGIYINNVANTLKRAASDIAQSTSCTEQVEIIGKYWQKNIKFISISVNFHETDSVTDSILSMKAYADAPNSPEFQYAKSKFLATIDEISLGEKINIFNIL